MQAVKELQIYELYATWEKKSLTWIILRTFAAEKERDTHKECNMLNDEPQWVAVYTESRAERKVRDRIGNLGIECYLPLVRKTRKWSDRMKVVEWPLFPGYLFAKITLRQVSRVRDTVGAVLIVGWAGRPATIPDKEVEFVRAMVDEMRAVETRNLDELKAGVRVRIREGVFQGMEGVLVEEDANAKFAIKIEVLNTYFVTQIDKNLLTALPPETKKGIWKS